MESHALLAAAEPQAEAAAAHLDRAFTLVVYHNVVFVKVQIVKIGRRSLFHLVFERDVIRVSDEIRHDRAGGFFPGSLADSDVNSLLLLGETPEMRASVDLFYA